MTKKLMIALVSCFATAGLAAGCESPAEQRIEETYDQREENLEQQYDQQEEQLEQEEDSMKRQAEEGQDPMFPPPGE